MTKHATKESDGFDRAPVTLDQAVLLAGAGAEGANERPLPIQA
jgi:hypothetical protein